MAIPLVFLDTEFSDLLHPGLLSIGLVCDDGGECYVELDLSTKLGAKRAEESSDFARYGPVLEQWGRVPGAACSYVDMGRRAGEWLLAEARQLGVNSGSSDSDKIAVVHDYSTDYELLEYAIRDSGLWTRVRAVVRPVNVLRDIDCIAAEMAKEIAFAELAARRDLHRHHALADAIALRAAYRAVFDTGQP